MNDNLTGVWNGTYVQKHVGMVTFLATLIDFGGALGGSVTEPCALPNCPQRTHNASIAGHRSGNAVSFVKTYEPSGCAYDTVTYEGLVNAEATEIDGRWTLPNSMGAGNFLMVRSKPPAQSVAVEQQNSEPVR
jgi:hypothetical protein